MQVEGIPSDNPTSSTNEAPIVGGPTEEAMLEIWRNIFGFDDILPDSDFFDLGGDSMAAAKLQLSLKKKFGVVIGTADIVRHPTPTDLREKIESAMAGFRREEILSSSQNVIPLQPRGAGRPMFVISESMIFRNLALKLGTGQPVYTIRMDGGDSVSSSSTFDEIVDFYLQWMRRMQPTGPYRLAGWCVSGWIAYGVARRLEDQGEKVELLVVIDIVAPGYWSHCKGTTKLGFTWQRLKVARKTTPILQLILKNSRRARKTPEEKAADKLDETASQAQSFGPLQGPMVLFRSADDPIATLPQSLGWDRILERPVQAISIPGSHHKIFETRGAEIMAKAILAKLE